MTSPTLSTRRKTRPPHPHLPSGRDQHISEAIAGRGARTCDWRWHDLPAALRPCAGGAVDPGKRAFVQLGLCPKPPPAICCQQRWGTSERWRAFCLVKACPLRSWPKPVWFTRWWMTTPCSQPRRHWPPGWRRSRCKPPWPRRSSLKAMPHQLSRQPSPRKQGVPAPHAKRGRTGQIPRFSTTRPHGLMRHALRCPAAEALQCPDHEFVDQVRPGSVLSPPMVRTTRRHECPQGPSPARLRASPRSVSRQTQ